MNWDLATDIILAAAIAALGVFAALALYQWVTRKSLSRVDRPLVKMLVPLALMLVTYIVFDKFLICNTRPNGSGEPSFPSTHVMVVATIFALLAINIPRYVRPKPLRLALYVLMVIFTALVAVGRVLADMHWPSDVVGGLAFAAIFAVIYYLITRKDFKHEQHL